MLRAIDNLCSVTNYRQSGEFDTTDPLAVISVTQL